MCLNPVHCERVCEKLYHKTGYERKKLPEKKKKSEHGFNWCLPVVWPLFPSPFFCLSASLGLIRPAVESGSLGKHSRVWLELRLKEAEIGAGCGGGASWGASTSDHFPLCNTPCSLERWQAAASPLPFVFFPSLLHFLPFHPTFLPMSHNHCLRLLFPPAHHHPTFYSSFSHSSSHCPSCCTSCRGKQTVTFGNDPLQTSVQWHQNKSRNSSPLPSFYHFQCRLKTTVQGTTINSSVPWSLSPPLDACSVVPYRVQTCFRVLTGPWPTPERFSWVGTVCVWVCTSLCVSVCVSEIGPS